MTIHPLLFTGAVVAAIFLGIVITFMAFSWALKEQDDKQVTKDANDYSEPFMGEFAAPQPHSFS